MIAVIAGETLQSVSSEQADNTYKQNNGMNEIRLVCVDFLFVCLFFVEILINFEMFVAFVALFVEIVLEFWKQKCFCCFVCWHFVELWNVCFLKKVLARNVFCAFCISFLKQRSF